MIIDTILSLDTASFQTGMGKAVQGVQSFVGIIQGLSGKMQGAFDIGGSLSDTSSILGESAGNVMILQRAFENAGLGAEAMEGSLLKMRKELASTDNFGKASNKTFEKLGLNVEKIKELKGEQQIQSIAAAIMGLPNASDKAAASMEIFGKGGGRMLALFADGSGFDQARQQLGGLADLMTRNAPAFDMISDRIGSIKKKSMGLWAGFAEGMLPAADYITKNLDKIDLTGIGQKFGKSVMTVFAMIKGEGIGETLYNGVASAFQNAANYGLKAFKSLGKSILMDVISPLNAGIQGMLEDVLMPDKATRKQNANDSANFLKNLTGGMIPGLDRLKEAQMRNIEDEFKNGGPQKSSFEERLNAARDFWNRNIPSLSLPTPDIFPKNTAEQQSWMNMWKKYSLDVDKAISEIQKKADSVKPFGSDISTAPVVDVKEQKSIDVKSDALSKVGGFLGGFNIMGGMLQLAKDSLDVQRGILNAVKQQRGGAKFA